MNVFIFFSFYECDNVCVMAAEEDCFFNGKIPSCPGPKEKLSKCSRIQKIIEASELRDHLDIHDSLEPGYTSGTVTHVYCHKNCVSTYVSPQNFAHLYHKRKPHSSLKPEPKRLRSEMKGKRFDFKKHCMFCLDVTECKLDSEYDAKTPAQYRVPSSMVVTTDTCDGQVYIDTLIQKCIERNDDLGRAVHDRLLAAAGGDLVAAEARYHRKCSCLFHKPAVSKDDYSDSMVDTALLQTLEVLEQYRTQIWNTVEIMDVYEQKGGANLSRRTLLEKVESHFGDEILSFHSPGIAALVVFKNSVANTLKIVNAEDEDEDVTLKKLGKEIAQELKAVKRELTSYDVHIDKPSATECTSNLLHKLLSKVHPNFTSDSSPSLSSIMVGNIVASVTANQPTPLQIALGVLMSEHKSVINMLYKFRITCSYDEVRRFLRSAAVQAARDTALSGLTDASVGGLVQVIIDNFDAVIHSQNCRLDCHNLAMVVTQCKPTPLTHDVTIPRLTKEQMKEPIDLDQVVVRYTGPKKPDMPQQFSINFKPSDDLKQAIRISLNRARQLDFNFLSTVFQEANTPEYNGFNTRFCREAGMMPASKSAVRYMPLLYMKPADPDTVNTAIVNGLRIVQEANQEYLVITADQQIYKVIVDILFATPDLMFKVIPILGFMHFLMDFVSCIGKLMAGSGLKNILCGTFGSVDKMLEGKKYPQNVRALRLLTEQLLHPIIENNELNNMADLENLLADLSTKSRTTKAWTELVIKPVLLSMQFTRATHEPDYALLFTTMNKMLPYFFAAHKHNYARYGTFFCRSLTWLPSEVEQQFLRGEQILHHMEGLWNGIPLDQFIETTWMKRGKGPSGVIGNTQNPQTVATWSYSQHAVVTLMGDLNMMTDEDSLPKLKHKEETTGRINSDTQDRESLHHTLSECIDPMDPGSHRDGSLINIVTGAIAPANVNIDEAVSQGQEQLETFESSWPEGFYNNIKQQVVTFSDKRNAIKVGDTLVIDQEAIYARVIGLMVSQRELDLKDVLGCELAAYPPSMFHPDGSMRIATGKACLKNILAVETSVRVWGQPSVIVVDVSAVLWTINWSTKGTVQTFVNEVKIWVANKLNSADVHLVFDRYYDYSTKSSTRVARAGKTAASRVHKLSAKTPLPTRDAVLTCVANKVQLNHLILELIMNDQDFLDKVTSDHRLFMTGAEPVPTVVHKGRKRAELQLYSTHEEADIRLVMHALLSYETVDARVCVISDDTDVFALLCYHYHKSGSSGPLMMEPSVHGRVCVDIRETVKKHPTLISQVLAIHAISGCDTVAASYGIGKLTAVATSKKGFVLDSLGVIDAPWDHVEKEATHFMVGAYGGLGVTMSECRKRLWAQKTAKSSGAPKLCSLAPTTEAFTQNTKRAHFQVAQWYAALDSDPPPLDPRDYGWEADDINKSLSATTVAQGVCLAPDYVLKLIRCGCASESSCKRETCGCTGRQVPCTIFCACEAGPSCFNKFTTSQPTDEDEEEGGVQDGV